VINDGYLPVANDGKVWTDPPPAEISRVLAAAGLPTGATTLDVDVLMIRTGDRIVLIDSGLGALSPTTGRLLRNLAKAGVEPSQVTDVVITHGHADHIGGLWTPNGPATFPNARVRMTTAEWAALQRSPPPGFVSAVGPQVATFEPGAVILPGLTAVSVPGHTPGHTAVQIESGGRSLLAIGDAAHHYVVSLREPEFTISFDADPAVAEASRRALLTRLSRVGERIYSPHFPYPGLGVVRTEGDGFAWVPRP
jgi:glyoxylase-like metal-dependent hydrolase (beta-lactamase superfamily II)